MTVNISLTSECVKHNHPKQLLDLVWPGRTGEVDLTQTGDAFLGYNSVRDYFEAACEGGFGQDLSDGVMSLMLKEEKQGVDYPMFFFCWFNGEMDRAIDVAVQRQYAKVIAMTLAVPEVDLLPLANSPETSTIYDKVFALYRDESCCHNWIETYLQPASDALGLGTGDLAARRFECLYHLLILQGAGHEAGGNWELFEDMLEIINFTSFMDLHVNVQGTFGDQSLHSVSIDTLCGLLADNDYDCAALKAFTSQGCHTGTSGILNHLMVTFNLFSSSTSNH